MIENVNIGNIIIIRKDNSRRPPVLDGWVGTYHKVSYVDKNKIHVDDKFLYVGCNITLFEGEFYVVENPPSEENMERINRNKREMSR